MTLKLVTIAVLCFAISVANSTPVETDPLLSIVRKDSSSIYMVNYSGSKLGTVTLTIKDSSGNILIKRSIENQKDFLLPVNFSSVAEGEYLVQIDNGTEKKTMTVNYNNDTAPTYSRVSNLGDSRYLFTSSHAGTEKISIKIYDGNSVLVFDEYRVVKGTFALLFNLENVAGEPTFEVSGTSGNSLMIPGNSIVTVVK